MKTKKKIAIGVVVALTAIVLIFIQTDIFLMCSSGLTQGGPVGAVWAYFNSEFAPDFSERRFLTIRTGDTEASVIDKIGQPRAKPALSGNPIPWVYGLPPGTITDSISTDETSSLTTQDV